MAQIFQVKSLQSLMMGNYYGFLTYGEVKKQGNTGLGTFENMDGEMIMLDGVVYRADVNGNINVVDDNIKTPFCCVGFFNKEYSYNLNMVSSFDSLEEILTNKLKKEENNLFHMAVINAKFKSITYRSIKGQKEPYLPSNKIPSSERISYTKNDVEGTLVCVYTPDYLGNINFPGWHLHFIDRKKNYGGHVLELSIVDASVDVACFSDFKVVLPTGEMYNKLDLAHANKQDLEALEKK